jgi:hypothetical protein
MVSLAATSKPTPPPPISQGTQQLIGYGLLLGGAAVVGKLMIDGLVGDMEAAKARKAFIGPIQESPPPPRDVHVKLSDCVRFVAMCASVYSILAELPTLVSQWGQVESTVEDLIK